MKTWEKRLLFQRFDPTIVDWKEYEKKYMEPVHHFINGEENIEIEEAIRLMLHNIFDHAGRCGGMALTMKGSGLRFLVCDFGPGYQGPSKSTTVRGLAKFHQRSDNDGTKKTNIFKIVALLDEMMKYDRDASWTSNIKKRFRYVGYFTSMVYVHQPILCQPA
jgi:hypothetical protein